MTKNIVDVYKEVYGKLIILISGLSGSHKTVLGQNISRDFKLKLLNTKQFYKKDFAVTEKLSNEMVVVNYDCDDAFDWNAMNDEVNKLKQNGVVVVGHVFPTDKLLFDVDYHVHLKISKQELRKNRLEYIERHPEKGFNLETETLRINALTYPYYLSTLKRMKLNKFIDISEMSDDEIYDIVFGDIIKYIENNIYDKQIYNKKKKHFSESSNDSTSYDEEYVISYQEHDD